MNFLNSHTLFRRRTLTWKSVFLVFCMTAAAWLAALLPVPAQVEAWAGGVAQADEAAVVQDGEPVISPPAAPADDLNAEPPSGTDDEPAADTHSAHPAAHADDHSSGHQDPVAQILLAIFIILFLAKLSGDIFERMGMPAVLGELAVGIVLGNWALFTGSHALDFFKISESTDGNLTGTVLDMLARIGVVLLLFEVGLESRIKEMVSVGLSSLLVALLGVAVPMLLGFAVGYLLIGDGWQVPAFLGATLCATSVGITARVLKDLKRSQAKESRIILGAAVIDDILGLVVLAVVSGVIEDGADFEIMTLFRIIGLSLAFLAAALLLGVMQLPRMMFRAASFLRGQGLLVTTALMICFLFAWGANLVGLATIIGAFAAGLILEGAHYQEVGEKWKNHRLEDALAPLTALLVPIFFVATGIAVDLSEFSGGSVWVLAIALTVVAIVGKLVCAFGVTEKGLNRTAVGLGMIPRGEVGLIFAQVGQDLTRPDGQSVIDKGTFSAIVVMVMVTTLITPPLLKWSLSRSDSESDETPQPIGTA